MLNTEIEYYENKIDAKSPIGITTIGKWLQSIRLPKKETKHKLTNIQLASQKGDLKTKDNLKRSLYFMLGAVRTDGKGRTYENITSFTGICLIDFDKLEVEFAKELKEFIFNNYPYVIASYLSVSGKGVKVLVRIPVCKSVAEYKSYYFGLMEEFQFFKGLDYVHQNAVLPSFVSYDENILTREDAVEFTEKGFKLDSFESVEEIDANFEIKGGDKEKVVRAVQRMIAKVDEEGIGHTIVRGTALLLGGWCSFGYLTLSEAEELILGCMEKSVYLQKGFNGYKKTCLEMLKLGYTKPTKYE